jgi:hypothetical protein
LQTLAFRKKTLDIIVAIHPETNRVRREALRKTEFPPKSLNVPRRNKGIVQIVLIHQEGRENELDYTFIPAGHIETFWREFRFPEGFAPHSVRFGMDGNYDFECFLAERERLQTNNEWTLKKRLMQDSMLKAGVTEETIIQALKEVDRPDNERIQKIFRQNPDRAVQCAPLPASEGMATPKDIDTAPPQVTAQ